MTSKADYPKKVISFDKQIKQLQERGLIIEDINSAKEFLRNISYSPALRSVLTSEYYNFIDCPKDFQHLRLGLLYFINL